MQPRCAGSRLPHGTAGFNSHPAFWPDATAVRGVPPSAWYCGFQSSSGQKAGCNRLGHPDTRSRCTRFNPHSARRPDATGDAVGRDRCERVSILIRPEGRMQLASKGRGVLTVEFQSSSGQKAGCNLAGNRGVDTARISFQSSSGQKAGCNPVRSAVQRAPPHLFQSSSGQKAGCNGRSSR